MRKMLMMCNSDPSGRLWRLACRQGSRSCAKARRAFAEKFGLERKFRALTYAILSHFLEFFVQKSAFLGQKQ